VVKKNPTKNPDKVKQDRHPIAKIVIIKSHPWLMAEMKVSIGKARRILGQQPSQHQELFGKQKAGIK
jgi:hypothetical protein